MTVLVGFRRILYELFEKKNKLENTLIKSQEEFREEPLFETPKKFQEDSLEISHEES